MRRRLWILMMVMVAGCGDEGGGTPSQGDETAGSGAGSGGAASSAGAGAGAGRGGTSASAGVGGRAGADSGAGTGAGGSTPRAGSGGSSAGVGGGTAGSAGTGDPGSDTALFVPDIEGTYVGAVIDPGLEIVSHTIIESLLGTEWIVVLRNTSTDLRLCTATMETTFLDASGAEVAVSNLGIIRSALKRGCEGTCGFMNCINPGETGMMIDSNGISDADVTQFASYTYSFGALNIVDAVPSTDATVMSIEVFPDPIGDNRYHGLLVNHTSGPFTSASVYIFGLNAAGRPLLGVSDINPDDIAGGASWAFETLRFHVPPEDIASVVAYPEVHEP